MSDNDHPARERWAGQVDELPYETEAFDGGERVEIEFETVDGAVETFPGEVGEYMSHNSWLIIFGEDKSPEYRRPDFIVRRDGVVLIEPYMDGDMFQVGRCRSVRCITETSQDGGRDA